MKKEEKSGKKEAALWSLLGVLAYMGILAVFVPLVYGINDDRSMMEILSGQYLGTPDPHTVFIGYWYSLFVAFLYRIVPQADWYALLFLILQLSALFLILYKVVEGRKTRALRAAATGLLVLLFLVLGSQMTVQLSFTTTAAVLAMAVLCWYVLSEEIRAGDLALLFLLSFLAMEVRFHIFFMILPVCAVLWLFRMRRPQMRTLWHGLIPVAAAAVLVIELVGGRIFGYGSADWRAFLDYNDNRSWVYDYDYGLRPYEEAEDFYRSVGLEEKSRVRTLMNYNFTADEEMTPEFFGDYIAAYKEYYTLPSVGERLADSVKAYLKGLADFRFQRRHTVLLLLYGALAALYAARKRWESALRVLALAGVQVVLWIGLLYLGKLPERVLISMNLMLATALLLEAWGFEKEFPPGRRTAALGLGLAFLLLGCLASRRVLLLREENQEMWARNESVDALKEYCMAHSENFYFSDVTSLAFSTYNVRLWRSEPYRMNYISLGDWTAYSPLWRRKLEQEGIGSVKEALYESERVYLICSFDKGLEYLVKLYDGVACEDVDNVAGFHIYCLRLETEKDGA